MSEEIATETQVEKSELPNPVLSGWFGIYEDGAGGYVLVTETEGGIQRKHIPAALVKMVTGGGMLGRKFGSLFG